MQWSWHWPAVRQTPFSPTPSVPHQHPLLSLSVCDLHFAAGQRHSKFASNFVCLFPPEPATNASSITARTRSRLSLQFAQITQATPLPPPPLCIYYKMSAAPYGAAKIETFSAYVSNVRYVLCVCISARRQWLAWVLCWQSETSWQCQHPNTHTHFYTICTFCKRFQAILDDFKRFISISDCNSLHNVLNYPGFKFDCRSHFYSVRFFLFFFQFCWFFALFRF